MEGEVLFTSAPSAPDLGCFSAREAGGMPFCAGNDTLFCAELPRNTFRAGLVVFFCPVGGWYLIPRRKRYLFLPGVAFEHLPRRIGGIFLLGRRVVSHSAQISPPLSARNASGAPSAPDLGHFPARKAVVAHSAQEKMPFSAWNRLEAPSAPDLGCFPAREAGGMPFCGGKDTFFCPESPWNIFRAGFGVFFCPGGGWYPILRWKRCIFLLGVASEHLLRRIWGVFLPGRRLVSHSAPEKIPFSAWNRPGAPSAQD